jgi:hypothetical protein
MRHRRGLDLSKCVIRGIARGNLAVTKLRSVLSDDPVSLGTLPDCGALDGSGPRLSPIPQTDVNDPPPIRCQQGV